MSQATLLSEHPALLEVLPQWGTTAGGVLYEHQTPAHLTGVRDGFALLKTPQASDNPRGRPQRFHQRNEPDGRYDLPDQLATLMPTPVVNDMGAGKTVEAWDAWVCQPHIGHHGNSLSVEMKRLMPTPDTGCENMASKPKPTGETMALPSSDGQASLGGQPPTPPTKKE
jgi:hypothetical protein